MGKRLRANVSGSVKEYVTQSRALRRLQVPLSEFRRLCVLHGIHPREPSKKIHGKNKSYFSLDDIRRIEKSGILDQVGERSALRKKASVLRVRGKGKSMSKLVKELEKGVDISPVMKERYPSFERAMEDFGECVSTLAVLSVLPANRGCGLSPELLKEVRESYESFLKFVEDNRCLTRVFASIKGFYLEAKFELRNGSVESALSGSASEQSESGKSAETTRPVESKPVESFVVMWLHPHGFVTELPEVVDGRVFSTFGSMYVPLCQSVLTHMKSRILPGGVSGRAKRGFKTIFHGVQVALSNEVPKRLMQLIVLSAGGSIVDWKAADNTSTDKSKRVDIYVSDREAGRDDSSGRSETSTRLQFTYPKDADVVQPQYIFDSFNGNKMEPVAQYDPRNPSVQLPPHLSPFEESNRSEGSGSASARKAFLSASGWVSAKSILEACEGDLQVAELVAQSLNECEHVGLPVKTLASEIAREVATVREQQKVALKRKREQESRDRASAKEVADKVAARLPIDWKEKVKPIVTEAVLAKRQEQFASMSKKHLRLFQRMFGLRGTDLKRNPTLISEKPEEGAPAATEE